LRRNPGKALLRAEELANSVEITASRSPDDATNAQAWSARIGLGRYIEIAQILAIRTLKVRYRGSILGIYWSLSNPVLMTFVYTAVFGTAFSSYYDNSILNYILACFVGLATLNFFSTSTSQALTSVVHNGALLNKIKLPPSVFPVSVLTANAFQFLVGTLPMLAVVTILRTHSVLNVIALLAPACALLLVAAGLSFIVSSLFVFFRDLPYLYELVIFVIWITSPVFYPAQLVPVVFKPFVALNPVATIMESFRQIALSTAHPSLRLMGASLATGIAFFLIGTACFAYLKDEFMDLV
jgi:ABC-type polysaccharide/polyol phosphate export permease